MVAHVNHLFLRSIGISYLSISKIAKLVKSGGRQKNNIYCFQISNQLIDLLTTHIIKKLK